jgi:hypothetical protein
MIKPTDYIPEPISIIMPDMEDESLVEFAKTDPERFVESYKDDLDKLVKALKDIIKENDQLRGITRTLDGEEVITEDEIVHDDETYL